MWHTAVSRHNTIAKEGKERAPKYHTIIRFMTRGSPLQKVSYVLSHSPPLHTIPPPKSTILDGTTPYNTGFDKDRIKSYAGPRANIISCMVPPYVDW